MMRSHRLSFLEGESHKLLMSVISSLLCIYSLWFIIPTLILAYQLFHTNRWLFYTALLIIPSIIFIHQTITMNPLEGTTHQVKIIRCDPDYSRLLVKGDIGRFYVYYDDTPEVKAGYIVLITGEFQSFHQPTMPGEFNYQRYLMSKRIDGAFYLKELSMLNKGHSINNVSEYIYQYIENNFTIAKPYMKTFVLANRTEFEEDFTSQLSKLGIAHLFAISGLHISLMLLIIHKFMTLLRMKETIIDIIIILFLIVFLFLTAFTPSVLRVSLMTILIVINKRLKTNFTTFDLCAYSAIILLIINPLYYVQVGFILTYLVTLSLLLSQSKLKHYSKPTQMVLVSSLAFFVTIPVISRFNYQIDALTIVYNIVFVTYTMFLLLPLGYITFIFPFLETIYGVVITIFEILIETVYQYFHLPIRLYFSQIWMIVLYLVLFFYSLSKSGKQKRNLMMMLGLYVLIIFMTPYLNFTQHLIFYDVYGDGILIQDKFNQCNILIDTGIKDNRKRLVNALKVQHITHLDYVFITHWHADHYGALDDVLSDFLVKNLYSSFNQSLIENKVINCGSISFIIYPKTNEELSENNDSLVIRLTIANEIILFTGDIEQKRENLLLKENLQATLLKVAHHGSKTSTSEAFLSSVNPKDAVISVYRFNTFNHPSEEVISRINNGSINLHRTDIEGTIIFQYRFKQRIKKTPYAP